MLDPATAPGLTHADGLDRPSPHDDLRMTTADADRWNARYAGQPLADPRRPDALTDDLEPLVPTAGRALDVACGAGGQTLWLAHRGLAVLALDVSDGAVAMTTAAVERESLTERVDTRVVDLDDGLPEPPDAPAEFDVIVCQRFRARHLYGAFVERLTPGGIAVVTVLSETGADDPGPFHAPPGELAAAFDRSEVEILRHVEVDGQESIVVRRSTD